MKQNLSIFLFIVVLTNLLFISTFAVNNEPQVESIAISLSVLQEKLVAGQMSPDIMQLGGIKKIDGFVVDTKNHDVILFGTTGSGLPLYLDDFIIALRSVFIDNAPPGCSIDPTETTLSKIREFNNNFSLVTSTTAADNILEEFKKIGAEPQNVRVITVPRNTHFAQVMVAADYFTKRISNGTALTDLEGFKSLSAIAIEKLKQDVAAGKHPQLTMYNRFWFTPGTVQFSPENDIVQLTQCDVKLLTEQQFLNSQGKLAGSGKEQPMAQQFVQEFTKRYDDIATAAPIFAELKSLFRFVAIAKGIQYDNAVLTAGIDLNYLLNKYMDNPARVPQTLPGITDVKKIEIQQKNREVYLWLLSFGGVDMDIKIDQKSWIKPTMETKKPGLVQPKTIIKPTVSSDTGNKTSPGLETTRDKILQSRPSSKELKWKIAQ